ncbi:MAG: hypothetical protein GX923_04940 [Clostridia bacterium]|nr:hypothetical protein [Clostridia bacterium]
MSLRKNPVDIKKLSKKYKVDVGKVIRAWKNNKNDLEISEALNIDMLKIFQIRQDVEEAHNQARLKRQKV